MFLLDDMLIDYVRQGKITKETAISKSQNARTFRTKLQEEGL
jgi:hypothetical protein